MDLCPEGPGKQGKGSLRGLVTLQTSLGEVESGEGKEEWEGAQTGCLEVLPRSPPPTCIVRHSRYLCLARRLALAVVQSLQSFSLFHAECLAP